MLTLYHYQDVCNTAATFGMRLTGKLGINGKWNDMNSVATPAYSPQKDVPLE